jgi:hypothetical protein
MHRLSLRHSSPLHTVNCAIRCRYLRANQLRWDDRFRVAEDTDYFVRVLRDARVVFVDRVLGQYRIGDEGLTRTARLESDLARVVQRQCLALEAMRAGIGDKEMWTSIATRLHGVEVDLAYHLRKHGRPMLAFRVALRAFVLRPTASILIEMMKSLVERIFRRRASSDSSYWG